MRVTRNSSFIDRLSSWGQNGVNTNTDPAADAYIDIPRQIPAEQLKKLQDLNNEMSDRSLESEFFKQCLTSGFMGERWNVLEEIDGYIEDYFEDAIDNQEEFINAAKTWDATPDECRQLAAMVHKNHMFHEGEKFKFSSCGELSSFQFFFSFFERVHNTYGDYVRNSTTEHELRNFSERDCDAAGAAYTVAIVASALLLAASLTFFGAAGRFQSFRMWWLVNMGVLDGVVFGAVLTMVATAHRSWDVSAGATAYEVFLLIGTIVYGVLVGVECCRGADATEGSLVATML
jgi:hypothetical protein